MVHAQQVEESRINKKNREAKNPKSYEGGSSKRRFDIQDKCRFKKWFYNEVPFEFISTRDDKVSNPMSQKGRGTSFP